MKDSTIRLFEHIKLLQRGVDLAQKGKISSASSSQQLSRGFNGDPVRIGLLGATSAGKTTLIRRILADSAGKISSKPETACLVVHSFMNVECVVFELNPSLSFKDGKKSSEFREFVKKFDLLRSYERKDDKSWKAVESKVTKELDREEVLDFFAQVNDFDRVFKSIKWNHKQRRSEYSLAELIDIYDLPGFGGKDAHDETADNVIGEEKFDILLYILETSQGIPSSDQKDHLKLIEQYLRDNPSVKMYWAYEKGSAETLDIAKSEENIRTALRELEIDIDARLLDLTGFDAGDERDDISDRILRDVLRPFFVDIGDQYYNTLYTRSASDDVAKNDKDVIWKKCFEDVDSKGVITKFLDAIDSDSKGKKSALTTDEAMKMILEVLGVDGDISGCNAELSTTVTDGTSFDKNIGIFDRILSKGRQVYESGIGALWSKSDRSDGTQGAISGKSDKDVALFKMRHKILCSIRKIVAAISSDGEPGIVSIDKVRKFVDGVYSHDADLRTLVYDVQYYHMLHDYESVRGCIMKPIVDSLRENIKKEVAAIRDYSEDDE